MRWALLALLILLAAAAASADIRLLMRARGYSGHNEASGPAGSGNSPRIESATLLPEDSVCTLPGTLPCLLGY